MTNDMTDRRTVLRGAAVAGLAGVSVPLIAACSSNDTSSTPTSSAPTSAPSSAPSSSAPAGGGVLGPAADVPVGGGAVFKDAKVVVTQPAAGQYKGFSAVCTHMGCIVATVANNTIDCPCHGSKYSVTDGSVVNGPATKPLAPVPVSMKNGNIVSA
jgi:Rieske Fe-S protein